MIGPALASFAARLPQPAARSLSEGLGTLGFRTSAVLRQRMLQQLAAALPRLSPGERWQLAKDSCRFHGRLIAEDHTAGRLSAAAWCRRLDLDGWRHLQQAQESGCGAILLCPSWGFGPLAALAAALYAQALDATAPGGGQPAPFGTLRQRCQRPPQPASRVIRQLLRALRRGDTVCLPLGPPRTGDTTVLLPLLGGSVPASTLAARLALRTGAALVPAFGYELPGGRYLAQVRPALLALPGDTATSLTARCLEVLAAEIRHHPHTWPWHRTWWTP